jgi:RND family efflux transporter MFP subunit
MPTETRLDMNVDTKMNPGQNSGFCIRPIAFLALGGLSLVLGALPGCADSEPVMPPPKTVLVHVVKESQSLGRKFSGQLQAAERSTLAFEIAGSVSGINVELGDTFSEGEVLAELDSRSLTIELSAQRARLVEANATLVDARLDYDRRASLQGTGAVSQSDIDRAKAELDRAEAQVETRQADIERAKEQLADAVIVAPFDGEVVERLVEPSEVVGGGVPVLRIVGSDSSLEAVVYVPGEVRGQLAIGQQTTISLLDHTASTDGQVTEIGAQASDAGLFPITIALITPPEYVRPGESIEATIQLANEVSRVWIPLTSYESLSTNLGSAFVIEQRDGVYIAESRSVTLGELQDHGVSVVSGLRPGETIVSKGVELLSDGEVVHITGIGISNYNQ